MKKNILITLGIIIVAIIAGLIYTNEQSRTNTTTEIKVGCSILPVCDIVKNVSGDKITIIQILPNGVSEHEYEPSISDQEKLTGVKATFLIGAELDPWAETMTKNVSSNAQIIDLSKTVDLKHHEETENHDEEKEEEHEHEGEFDPHYWLSIKNAQKIAQSIKDKLSEVDPHNKDLYQSNFDKYNQELETLYIESKQKLELINNKEIITFHEAFGYFAEEFNIKIITTIEPFPGQEPTPAYLNELSEIIEKHNIKILFKEPQLSDRIVASLTEQYDIKLYTLDPIGGIDGRNSYIDLIKYNVDTIYTALNTN